MNFFFKILLIIFLNFSFYQFSNSEEITENTSILKKINELGEFKEPKKYPQGMTKLFQQGCTGFSCTADNLAKEMLSRFNRKGKFVEKYPGNQLYAMAMFEVFYQKKLKDSEDKIKKFKQTVEGKKKFKKDITSLIKLNEARKKMRSSLGMNLALSTEEAMENFWLMADFLESGEKNKITLTKDIKIRKKILSDYRKIVSDLRADLKKKEEEKFYKKILDKKDLRIDLLKKNLSKKMRKNINSIRAKLEKLPEGKTPLTKNFDKSFFELKKIENLIVKNLQNENKKSARITLDVLSKKLNSIQNELPKEITNDLSKVDINKLGEGAQMRISTLTTGIKRKKDKDFAQLINNMSEINKNGLNTFKLSRNLKQLGFETIKYENISKLVNNNNIKAVSQSQNLDDLLQERINFTKKLMSKLGYKNEEIKKEIEIINSTGINNEISQNILTARQMMISGASDKEIQNEINQWDNINVSSLQDDAYILALNARAKGLQAKNVKNRIEVTNAVATFREVDKILTNVEKQIKKTDLNKSYPTEKDIEENTLVFAHAAGAGYTNNFFSSGDKKIFYNDFLEEQKNKQIEIFKTRYTVSEIYKEINTPLTIVSVIVSPSPLNVAKLALIAKEQADEKKARVLASKSFGAGEDELGAGDYVDPRIFERTAKILNSIQIKDFQAKNLSKKLNYSISLISLEASNQEIVDQSDDLTSEIKKEGKKIKDQLPKNICVDNDCFVPAPPIVNPPRPINPILPIDIFVNKAERVNKVELIKDFQSMIQDKNISTIEISNRTLSNTKVIDMQLYFEELGIADAAEKVSKAYAEVGLSKDGMPSIDAIMDPSFNVTAHLDAMDAVTSEAGLQADIASASQAAADVQDAINAASGQISEQLAQANAEAQKALADAQKALDESRQDPNRDRSGESCSSGGGTC